jgi:DHA2 family lincomycin resistance protein-like MFS transporter
LIKRFKLNSILRGALCILFLGLLLSFIPNADMQWVIAIPLGFGGAITYPVCMSLLSDSFPADRQGLLMGIIGLLLSLSWLLSAILPGLLISLSPWLSLWLAALLMFLAFLLSNIDLKEAQFNRTSEA